MAQYYCKEGKIPKPEKTGTRRLFPKDAKKPVDKRTMDGRTKENGQ